jgi:uncharacterized protein (DUF983 family)
LPEENFNSRPVRRPIAGAAWRGFRNRCPGCGEGALLAGYLSPHAACSECGEKNGEIMAQDAPPYITILIVGHIILPLILFWEQMRAASIWVQYSVWLTATVGLTFLLLPRVKGAWTGLMWALSLKGTERQ